MNGSTRSPLSPGAAGRTHSLANSLGSPGGKRRPVGALLQPVAAAWSSVHSVAGRLRSPLSGAGGADHETPATDDYSANLPKREGHLQVGSLPGAGHPRKNNRGSQRSPQGRQKRPGESNGIRRPDWIHANRGSKGESLA